jgi:hypothetical protein
MAENTISLNYKDNLDMSAFIASMSPSVGSTISLTIAVGVTEYDDDRLNGVITNIDRDPYADYDMAPDPAAEEFTGETEESLNSFDSNLASGSGPLVDIDGPAIQGGDDDQPEEPEEAVSAGGY